jgi:hypothetical protein
MTEEFAEATRATRIKAILLYLAMGTWWIAQMSFIQPFFKQKLAQPLCDALPWTRTVLIYWTTLLLLGAAGLVRASLLTLRSGQSPFPGAWLLFRKPIARGWRAKLDGYIFAAFALAIVAALVWVWFSFGAVHIFCIFEPCPC